MNWSLLKICFAIMSLAVPEYSAVYIIVNNSEKLDDNNNVWKYDVWNRNGVKGKISVVSMTPSPRDTSENTEAKTEKGSVPNLGSRDNSVIGVPQEGNSESPARDTINLDGYSITVNHKDGESYVQSFEGTLASNTSDGFYIFACGKRAYRGTSEADLTVNIYETGTNKVNEKYKVTDTEIAKTPIVRLTYSPTTQIMKKVDPQPKTLEYFQQNVVYVKELRGGGTREAKITHMDKSGERLDGLRDTYYYFALGETVVSST